MDQQEIGHRLLPIGCDIRPTRRAISSVNARADSHRDPPKISWMDALSTPLASVVPKSPNLLEAPRPRPRGTLPSVPSRPMWLMRAVSSCLITNAIYTRWGSGVSAFLMRLVVEREVFASMQDQAEPAILFLLNKGRHGVLSPLDAL